MKKLITNLAVLTMVFSTVVTANAQVFNVDTIMKNGDLDKRINIVFLGDGYQSTELGAYHNDVQFAFDSLFNTPPFKEYKNYFNVFAVDVISAESGADHPQTANDETFTQPLADVNTVMDVSFDIGGIHRLVYPKSGSGVFNVLQDNFPMYDEVMIVSNSPYYGGGGGAWAVFTAHPASPDVAIHELGHSFGHLGDEYNGSNTFCGERPNVTGETDPNLIKWKQWINPGTPIPTTYDPLDPDRVGLFEGAGIKTNDCYRPRYRCKMRSLGVPFCQVCIEQMVIQTHNAVSAIESYAPTASNINVGPNTTVSFNVDVIQPDPATMLIEWVVNGNVLASGTNAFDFTTGSEVCGYQVVARVKDTTPFVRKYMEPDSVVWFIGDNVSDFLGNDTTVCRGESFVLNAIDGSDYHWEPSFGLSCTDCQNPTVTPYFTQTYHVSAVDLNGCFVTDEITITAGGPSVFISGGYQVYPGYAPLECTDLSAFVYQGVAPYTYQWSTGETTQTINVCPSTSTQYSVTVTDATGCSTTETFYIVAIDVRCNDGENNGNNEDKILLCHAPPGQLYNCQTNCVGASSVQNHLDHGDYIGPCRPRGCGIIIFNDGEEIEAAPEGDLNNHQGHAHPHTILHTAPNPFSGLVNIEVYVENRARVEIYITDIAGRLIKTIRPGELENGTYKFEWNGTAEDGGSLSNGIYTCKAVVGGKTAVSKMILMR